MPYWLRGYGDLGYVTGDARILTRPRRWIDAILATQDTDGWFGPKALRTSLEGGPDFWPHMPLPGRAPVVVRAHAATPRHPVHAASTSSYMNAQGPRTRSTAGWAALRWGDNIETSTGSTTAPANLAARPGRKDPHRTADWTTASSTGTTSTSRRASASRRSTGMQSADAQHLGPPYRNYATVMEQYGQFPGGGFGGDENARPGFPDPRQGFETCGIVEFMHSFEMLTRITGDPIWADRCEELAFNSLPASLDAGSQGAALHHLRQQRAASTTPEDTGASSRTARHVQLQPGVDSLPLLPAQRRPWAGRTTPRSCGSRPPTTACAPRCTRRARSRRRSARRHGGHRHRGDRLPLQRHDHASP